MTTTPGQGTPMITKRETSEEQVTKLGNVPANRQARRRAEKDLSDIVVQIDRTHFYKGDTVILYVAAPITPAMVRVLGAALERQKMGLHLIILPVTMKLESLSKYQMEKLGYVPKEEHEGLILPLHLQG